jgi:N-acetylmuramic acid 6-phosphate etherase
LIYVGAGTSGRLGVLDAAECPPTFRTPAELIVGLIAGGHSALTRAVEGAEDDPHQGRRDLQAIGLTAQDVVVGIATSGRTPYVLGAVRYAKDLGAFTIGLACNPGSELESFVDLPIIPVVGPEVLTGSTRLKAGTATKLILNMLSTGTMVLLGKTYGHLMVDLKATNTKLQDRARRIVRQLTQLPHDQVEELLQRCQGEVKTAVVVHQLCVTPDEARRRLTEVSGRVRLALGEKKPIPAVSFAHDLVLGIDGGGTSTVAILAEHATGTILGRGVAGPSNINSVGQATACQALGDAIEKAFQKAGRPQGTVASCCLGLAGAGQAAGEQVIRQWAEQFRIASRIQVTTDVALLFEALPEKSGIAVIAGTGSIVVGRASDGRMKRAGGWGPLLGDEGSSYRIAVAALSAIAHSVDGILPPTRLCDLFLTHFCVPTPHDLIPIIYRGDCNRTKLAALAPLVIQTAEEGDGVAFELVKQQATALAGTTRAVMKQLGFSTPGSLALAGGLLVGSEYYRQEFLDQVRPDAFVIVSEPALGAVSLARSL